MLKYKIDKDKYNRVIILFEDDDHLWELFPRDPKEISKYIIEIENGIKDKSETNFQFPTIMYDLGPKKVLAINTWEENCNKEYETQEILDALVEWRGALEKWEEEKLSEKDEL